MGCGTSKLDDLPAVALCRERCAFLDETIRQRFALSESHSAYLHSLNAVGISLDRFFNQHYYNLGPEPVLGLPVQRKGDPDPPDSHSDSGSHIHFLSDDDSEDGPGSGSEPQHHLHHDNGDDLLKTGYLMKSQTTPSVVYTQMPMSTIETMHIGNGGESSASYYNNYSVNSYNPNYSYNKNHEHIMNPDRPSYPNQYNFSENNFNGGVRDGFVVDSSLLHISDPPSSSAWDLLYPFESFEKYYYTLLPIHDSKEVREEEGIPDLEDDDDDDDDDEAVKEVEKFVDSGLSKPGGGLEQDDGVATNDDATLQDKAATTSNVGIMESDEVDKKKVVAVADEESSKDQLCNATRGGGRIFKNDGDVVREIQLEFDRASHSQTELLMFLEVGKLEYKRKHVSSKMLHLPVVTSQPSTSKSSEKCDLASLDGDLALDLSSNSLSSTLHKLYLWEKKLYEQVKVEEKIRVLHERKSRKLKRLDEKGAEPHKVDAARNLVRSLSTKIRIAIQVVDRISVKINSLRDDELWPLLIEFIQGLTKMWKSMLECHHNQCQAIAEAKRLDAVVFHNQFSDASFEATRQLEQDLINWTLCFSYWVGAQKGYVGALNNWLMKCLLYVPEETPDGIVPFSPSRIGAPLVFVVCNQWWQSLDKVSEKEVIDSMRELASNVLQLWDRDKAEMRERMLSDKDERKIKSLDKEDQKIRKGIQALDKRIVPSSGDQIYTVLTGNVVYHSETTKGGSLQACLRRVLEAIEMFTADTLKVYEELLQRIEEDHVGSKHEEVS